MKLESQIEEINKIMTKFAFRNEFAHQNIQHAEFHGFKH